MDKIKTVKRTRKGMSTVLLYVHIPVIINEKQIVYPDGTTSPWNCENAKLIKSKLKSRITRDDIIQSFEGTNEMEIQDCFISDEEENDE